MGIYLKLRWVKVDTCLSIIAILTLNKTYVYSKKRLDPQSLDIRKCGMPCTDYAFKRSYEVSKGGGSTALVKTHTFFHLATPD